VVSTSTAAALPLITARLRLRALQWADLEELHRLYTDPRVVAFIGPHTRADVELELRFDIAHQADHGWAFWAVEERSTGRLLGVCGLRPLEMRGPEIELGYDLHPEVWGRGFASEAARATIELALGKLGFERVVAVVKPRHLASRRVLEKAGLTHVGARRAYEEDLLLYEVHG
jgi:ribosomal-protein-alanine N-acetyltransferase